METQEFSFKADADAVRSALDTIRIITPPGVTEQGLAGFLFVVGKKSDKRDDGTGNTVAGPDDGKEFCWVYSRDALHAARAEFPITDLQGTNGEHTGFVYLSNHIDSFKYVRGDVTFNVKSDFEGNNFTVKWGYGAGASTERVTLDPRLLSSLDKRLNEATGHHTYMTALLREALKAGKGFLADDSDRNAKDEYKIINIYDPSMSKDGKGDGTLHSTDGYQRLYFQCDDFKGKGLQIHSQHIGLVESFLSKVGPEVVICTGSDMTYAMKPDKSRILGWSKHTKPPLEYKALPKSWDKTVLLVKDKNMLVEQLQFIKSEMEKGRDKIKIEYNNDSKQLRFHILAGAKTTSLPIDVDLAEGSEGRSYTHDVNIDQLLGLFKDVKAAVVEFRMFLMEEHGGPKGGAGFRTVDEFWLDKEGKILGGSGMPAAPEGGFQCKVTRFMPSKL